MSSSTSKTTAIITPRLTLEPLCEDHAIESFDAWQDKRLFVYIPVDPPVDVGTLVARYRTLAGHDPTDSGELWLNWFMRDRVSKQLIGLIECTLFPDKTAQIAYFVFVKWQREDYAVEGCRAVIDVLRRKHHATHVQAFVDTRNTASIALAGRLGLQKKKRISNADFFKGASSDEFLFSAPIDSLELLRK